MTEKKAGKAAAIALPVALIAVAAGFLFWMLSGAWGYRAADWDDTDGLRYYRNPLTRQTFAADAEWDGEDGAVITVPDEVHGYKVTALGGYSGRGVPSAFMLKVPETWDAEESFGDAQSAADAASMKSVVCTLTLRIGKNVRELNEVSCFGLQGRDENGEEMAWRFHWYVECDEENETFYAENGRLYTRADGKLVTDFIYWNEAI